MPKLNKRDKSKSALGKINQANAIIDNLKDSTIGSLTDSVNTLSTNYNLIYDDMQELIADLLLSLLLSFGIIKPYTFYSFLSNAQRYLYLI
jgi:hypothetical protein